METIKEELLEIKKLIKKQHILVKEILTLEETVIYLGLSKSTLYKLTSKKQIPHYVPGGKKIYFKRSELDNWIFQYKVYSTAEMESNICDYLSKPSKTKV